MKAVTGNRLSDGRVVYLAPDDSWTERLSGAQLFGDEDAGDVIAAAKRRVHEVVNAKGINAEADALGIDRTTYALRRRWRVITTLLVAALILEAALAGAMLSGVGWARAGHAVSAVLLIGATLGAGAIGVITLRRVPNGLSLTLSLLVLAGLLLLQTAVGKLSAQGANLLWVHIPLGVTLVAFAAHAVSCARRLVA